MFSSLEIWDVIVAGLLAIAGFFIPFAPHVPHSRMARVLFVAVPLGLLAISQYLWATTGRGLIEHGTCLILRESASCKTFNSVQGAPSPENQTPPPSESNPTSQTPQPSAGAPQATSPPPASSNNSNPTSQTNQPQETITPAPGTSEVVRLTDSNSKDIWSTSVYSYAPGGGGPGGGLANDRLRVGGWGDQYVALIQFDMPDVSCASKVVLQLYNSNDSDAPTPITLNVITAPWDWQRSDRLWWRDLPSSTQWGQVISAPNTNAWLSIDISDLFAKWCRKEMPNYGIMLRPVLNNNNYDAFYSTRYTGSDDLTPRLVISN